MTRILAVLAAVGGALLVVVTLRLAGLVLRAPGPAREDARAAEDAVTLSG